jgi:enterochelin esterase-like enzyme
MENGYSFLKRYLFLAVGIFLALFISACSPSVELSNPPLTETTQAAQNLANTPHSIPTEVRSTALQVNLEPASPTPLNSPTPLGQPAPLPSPTLFVCNQSKGSLIHDQIVTELLHHPIDFRVYLPPCYDQETDRRYPVLYLLHGQSYNDDQWDRLGVDETADELIYSGEAAPFIIVMPRYRIWFQPDEHNFGQAMVEVLIPYMDLHFRTIPDRSQRAIGGLSMGAAWALHLGLSRWDLFGAVGLHSLALFSIDSPRIPGWLDTIPKDQLPRIYLDIGDRDSKNLLDSTRWFEETLTKKDIPHEWYLFNGYHEEKYWQEHTPGYIRWYTREW